MQIDIVKAENKHLADCKTALTESKLGEVYFPEEEEAIDALNEGISKGEIFIARNNENECLGFIWFILNGAFHSYPYLHIVAVKKEFRNLGIGKKLIAFFEETVSSLRMRTKKVVSLDGIYVGNISKSNGNQLKIIGMCILISDQSLVPVYIQIKVSNSSDEIEWMDCKLAQLGENGVIKIPYASNQWKKELYTLDENRIKWYY